MELSAKGAAFTRLHEGFVDHAYLDAATPPVLTIGIGFTWKSAAFRTWWKANRPGQPFDKSARMTRAEAEAVLLLLFREEYGKAVNDFLGKSVPQHVFDGMASPVFNLGPGSLNWNWAKAAKVGDYVKAATLLKTTGTTAGGKKLAGLVKRRADEAELIQFGDYEYGPMRAKPAVIAKLETDAALADRMLVRRERGPAVAALIRKLADLGHYHGTLDDLFGYGTEAAVLKFQRIAGIKPDGKVGPKTGQLLGLPYWN